MSKIGRFSFQILWPSQKDELYTYRLTIIIFRADGRVQQILEGINISTKGGFFSESAIRFFRSPNLQKKIFQKTILSLKF